MEARRREPERHEEREERVEREPREYRERRERLEPVEREEFVYSEATVGSVRDLVHWGPVWAGVIGGLATLIVLALLGIAIGLAAFDPTVGPGAIGTPSAIWGAIIMLVAFFVGGWLAGRTSSYRGTTFSGFILGSMVWALSVVLILLMTTLGFGGLLGAALNVFGTVPTTLPPGEALGVAQTASLWSFITLVVAYFVTVGGAIVGSRSMTTGPEEGRYERS